MSRTAQQFETADDAIFHLAQVVQHAARAPMSDSSRNAILTLILEYRRAERQLDGWVAQRDARRVSIARRNGIVNINGSRAYPMVEGKAPVGA
jgi:hypothetical protein